MFISDSSPRFSFYRLACAYTEGGEEDVGLAAGLVSVGQTIVV